MDEFMELAARVEAASGADRELDARIWAVVDPKEHDRQCSFRGMKHAGHVHTKAEKRAHILWAGKLFALAYTASIDAALSLVPEGLVFNIGNDAGCWAHVWKDDPSYDGHPIDGRGASLALALTTACLKARSLPGADEAGR